jgi:hypothetical protein
VVLRGWIQTFRRIWPDGEVIRIYGSLASMIV